MQIKNIHLKNFRGSEDLTVEFAPGINIIIGDNGAGKSSLLRGLRILLSRILSEDEHIIQAQILKEDVRLTSSTVGGATVALQYNFPSVVEGDIELRSIVSHCKSMRENENSDAFWDNLFLADDKSHDLKVEEYVTRLFNDRNSELPLINYQSDQKNLLTFSETKQISPVVIERRQGYEGALSGVYAEDSIQNWCLQMELRNFQEGRKIIEYETFKRTVTQFIEGVEGKKIQGKIYFAADMWTLIYFDGKNRLPLYSLSSGYQSILCMIMELAYRAALLNPSMSDYKSVEGVVLIDEIDTHLHPKWQWRIMDALCSLFPKVQFIVATHSPMIISSAENARLLLMNNPNEIEELPDAYGINVDNILELRQRSEGMPPELKEWRKRIMKFLNQNDVSSAEAVIREVEVKRGKDSAPAMALRDFYDINKWIAE